MSQGAAPGTQQVWTDLQKGQEVAAAVASYTPAIAQAVAAAASVAAALQIRSV
jgi:hypothetical protein